jgi:hypothetical protein
MEYLVKPTVEKSVVVEGYISVKVTKMVQEAHQEQEILYWTHALHSAQLEELFFWREKAYTIKRKGKMTMNISSKYYGLESQRTIKYRPTRMTDKKMMNFLPGLSIGSWCWIMIMSGTDRTQTRGLPVYVNGIKQTVDHYTPDEQEELKVTDKIAVSTYVKRNGPETETYTDRETAYEIRIELRDNLRT